MTLLPKPEKRARKPRKRPRKQRKGDTWGALRNKLDAAFSAYVKRRDGPVCVTCKRTITDSRDWHAGHFHGRTKYGTRWDFRNVHSQCGFVCNKVRRGAPREYALFIVATYGAKELERLAEAAKSQRKWTRPDMQELLDALGRGDADFESLYAERYML